MKKLKITFRKPCKETGLYEGLVFGTGDYLAALAASLALILLLSFLFYRSLPAALFLMPLLPIFLAVIRSEVRRKRERTLRADFTKLLEALSLSFRSGFSARGAFPECEKSLAISLGAAHPLTRAVRKICEGISLGVPPEDLFTRFAASTALPEIRDLAAVLSLGIRSGGDLCRLIDACDTRIRTRLEVREEIEGALAARKLELTILSVIPCAILLYMRYASPGFLDVLYGNAFGCVCMTACLIVYLLAVLWGRRIIAFEV